MGGFEVAKIKIEEIVYHLDSDIKNALKDAVDSVAPGNAIDKQSLYRAFKRAIARKCRVWEHVPDQYVEND